MATEATREAFRASYSLTHHTHLAIHFPLLQHLLTHFYRRIWRSALISLTTSHSWDQRTNTLPCQKVTVEISDGVLSWLHGTKSLGSWKAFPCNVHVVVLLFGNHHPVTGQTDLLLCYGIVPGPFRAEGWAGFRIPVSNSVFPMLTGLLGRRLGKRKMRAGLLTISFFLK